MKRKNLISIIIVHYQNTKPIQLNKYLFYSYNFQVHIC